MCQENYYGSSCNTFCSPTDTDGVGHYACDSQGQKKCNAGWKNETNNCLTGELHIIIAGFILSMKQLLVVLMGVTQLAELVHLLEDACKD